MSSGGWHFFTSRDKEKMRKLIFSAIPQTMFFPLTTSIDGFIFLIIPFAAQSSSGQLLVQLQPQQPEVIHVI